MNLTGDILLASKPPTYQLAPNPDLIFRKRQNPGDLIAICKRDLGSDINFYTTIGHWSGYAALGFKKCMFCYWKIKSSFQYNFRFANPGSNIPLTDFYVLEQISRWMDLRSIWLKGTNWIAYNRQGLILEID